MLDEIKNIENWEKSVNACRVDLLHLYHIPDYIAGNISPSADMKLSRTTIQNYLQYSTNAFLIYQSPTIDIAEKTELIVV